MQACNDDEIYIDATVRVLNHILGNTDSSRRFWAEELPAQIAMVPLFQIDPTPVARSAERELSPRELAQAANATRSSSENGSYTTTPAPAAATASHRVSDDKQLSFLHLLRNMRPHVDATALLFRLQEILGVCFSFAPFCESTVRTLSSRDREWRLIARMRPRPDCRADEHQFVGAPYASTALHTHAHLQDQSQDQAH